MRKRGSQKGFTMVEMLVSLAIFAVVTSFVTANLRAGQQGDELRIAGELVSSFLRRAQVSALGGVEVWYCTGGSAALTTCNSDGTGCAEGTCINDIPPSYGIRFSRLAGENQEMTFFVDLDREFDYDIGEEVRVDPISPGQFIEIVGFPQQPGDTLELFFAPPKPTMYINGADAESTAQIQIRHTGTNATRTVTINRISGQVFAE